jgi:protein SCO1/2
MLFFVAVNLFFTVSAGWAQDEARGLTVPLEIGFDEKPGAFVPLDVPFVTEDGKGVVFGDVLRGPTILTIVYYKCPNACDFLLSGLAAVLRTYADKPDSAPNLVSMTIDELETPADATIAKNIAYEAIEKPFPRGKWKFLTGSRDSILRVTGAVGFKFNRTGADFDHPIGIIILSPKGKVVRYIIGTDFLPADIMMSLMEASTGTIQPTIARVLRFCFSVDPKNHRLVFNTLQVSGTVIFLFAGVFVLYLVFGKKRRVKG